MAYRFRDVEALKRRLIAYDKSRVGGRSKPLFIETFTLLASYPSVSRSHGYSYPALETIANCLKTTKTRVSKFINELEEAGFLHIVRGYHGRCNRYTPNWALLSLNVHRRKTSSPTVPGNITKDDKTLPEFYHPSSHVSKNTGQLKKLHFESYTEEEKGEEELSTADSISAEEEEEFDQLHANSTVCSSFVPDLRNIWDKIHYFQEKYRLSFSKFVTIFGKFQIRTENQYFESKSHALYLFEKWIKAWQISWKLRRGKDELGQPKNRFYYKDRERRQHIAEYKAKEQAKWEKFLLVATYIKESKLQKGV